MSRWRKPTLILGRYQGQRCNSEDPVDIDEDGRGQEQPRAYRLDPPGNVGTRGHVFFFL